MRNLYPSTCVQAGVQPVQTPGKTVSSLCTYIVQTGPLPSPMRITHSLYAALCAAYAPNYPRLESVINRGGRGVMPTVHSPNNKNYMGNLKRIYRKTVEKEERG